MSDLFIPKWESWFAWHPVHLETGGWRWLWWVQRKEIGRSFNTWPTTVTIYRADPLYPMNIDGR